jgi:hypothetical protein
VAQAGARLAQAEAVAMRSEALASQKIAAEACAFAKKSSHTELAEAIAARSKTIAIEDETAAALAESRAKTATDATARSSPELLAPENDKTTLLVRFEELEARVAQICLGQIINAAFIFLGHTPGKVPKWDFYHRLRDDLDNVFKEVNSRNPNLQESTFRRMFLMLEPIPENPWLRGRNNSAHVVSVADARDSVALENGDDRELLTSWIDTICGSNLTKSSLILDDIAFRNRLEIGNDSVKRYDMLLKKRNASVLLYFRHYLSGLVAKTMTFRA